MAIFWLVLKIILWLLAALLGMILIALVIPITLDLRYEISTGFKAAIRILFIKFDLTAQESSTSSVPGTDDNLEHEYMLKEQTASSGSQKEIEKNNLSEEKKLQEQPAHINADTRYSKLNSNSKQSGNISDVSRKDKPVRKDTLSMLRRILKCTNEILSTAGKAMSMLFKGIFIHHINLYLPVHAEDAAKTAVKTGNTHAMLGAALGVLNNFLHLSFEEYSIEPDYAELHQDKAFFSCKISSCLLIMVIVAIWALPKGLKIYKKLEI